MDNKATPPLYPSITTGYPQQGNPQQGYSTQAPAIRVQPAPPVILVG